MRSAVTAALNRADRFGMIGFMEGALIEAGFTVIKAENASIRDMRRLVRDMKKMNTDPPAGVNAAPADEKCARARPGVRACRRTGVCIN
mgnify:CR=1 FL=1